MITCSKCGKQREATGFPRGVITPSPSGKDNVSQSVFGYCECGGYFSDLNSLIGENIKEQLTDFTSTWRTPTKEEDEREIIDSAKILQKKKWYESKKYLIKRIILCAYRLNNIHK